MRPDAQQQDRPTGAGDRFSFATSEGEVSGARFGAPGRPPLFFAHANGFTAITYRAMFEAMGAAHDVFAVDMRGHGRTTLPAEPAELANWETYGRDILNAIEAIEARFGVSGPWRLAGHSLGAVAALHAADARPETPDVRMIDPPIEVAPLWAMRSPLWKILAPRHPLFKGARERRADWPSREAARESYAKKALFGAWAPGVLDDYLEDGLVDAPGGVRLACAPEWEFATFMAQSRSAFAALRRVLSRPGASVAVYAAGRGSPLRGSVRRRLAGAGVAMLEDRSTSHLWPMERPEDAAAFLTGAALRY